MKNLFSTTVNTARTLGAATLLSTSVANSDEALLPPGTSLGQFPSSSIPTLQNAFANQIVSDITPDPALVPSNSFRWLLVKTDSGLALTLPNEYAGTIQHFGQQERFFVRFDINTGLPEISFDCATWQPYTAGTPVNMSREERATIQDISTHLQTLNDLQTQQATLSTTLAEQQAALTQVQEEITTLQTDLALTDYALALTESDLSQKESTKNTLETTMKPEAKLRTDTHPVALSTSLDDAQKNTAVAIALNTYDTSTSIAQMPAPSPRSPTSTFVPPTLADVQSTITVLTNELSRIQDQITTVNAQITAKQNEITATEQSIATKQSALDPIEEQLRQYLIDYNYWDGEVTRLRGLRDAAKTEMESIKTSYANNRTRLMNEGGRSDVPSDLTVSDISSQISSLKTRITNEHNAIAIAPNNWPTDVTTSGKTDLKSTTTVRLDSSYYFFTDFYSSAKSYPAKLETWFKPTGSSSAAKSSTIYTVNSQNHLASILSNTAKPKIEKLCDYAFVDKILETEKDNYLVASSEYEDYKTQAADATWERITASNNINSAGPLIDQYKAELEVLNQQKSTLTTQKSDLESLKNTKAQLQTLYTRVKTIIDQLKQHVSSHGAITQEIADLLTEAQTLENEIAALELLIISAEGDERDLNNKVSSTSEDLTVVNNTLTQTEQDLLLILQDIPNLRPADSITRTSSGALVPASEAWKYFADGFRTGYSTKTLSDLPVKWIIRYAYDGTNVESTNIYPASISLQYLLGGRAYATDGQRVNNFSHKELMNSDLEKIMTQLNACIAVLNQYPAGSSTGIENFFTALKAKIVQLTPSQSPNAIIRNHVTANIDFTRKTLLQGGSYALFEQLVAKNPTFASKIEAITAVAVQKGNIPAGTDAVIDMRHMITTIMAREFAEKLISYGDAVSIITTYTSWEQESLSFINGLGDESIWDKQWDINADWTTDAHGNKYKFGLYHPGGVNNSLYDPPATLFMLYSPDGSNTQVLGPVEVNSGAEADQTKERWKQELLKMKRRHVENYSGGSYDIFRGPDERGEYVYWGKYATTNGGTLLGTGFGNSAAGVESTVKNNILNSKIRSSIGLRVILPRGMDDIRKAEQYLLSLQSKYIYQISGISSKNGMRIDIESLDTLAEINSIRLGIISKIETPGFVGSLPQADVDYLFNLRNRLITGISADFAEQGGYWHIQSGKDGFAALHVLMVEFIGALMQSANIDAYRDSAIPFQSKEYYDSMDQVFQKQYTTFGDATHLLTQEILDAAYADDFYYLNTGNPPVGYDIMYYASFLLPGPSEGAFALKSSSLARVAVKGGSKLEKLLFKEVAPGVVRQVAENGRITEIANGLAYRVSPEVDAMESVFHSRIGTFAQSDINTILSKDPTVVADEIYKIARDKEGRMVFLNKGTVYVDVNQKGYGSDHLIREVEVSKDGLSNSTRYEQLKSGDNPIISDGEDVEDLIDKILLDTVPEPGVNYPNSLDYTKIINGKTITIATNSDSGKIITIKISKN